MQARRIINRLEASFKGLKSTMPPLFHKCHHGNSGFTLIEIMISLALTGMVLGGVYGVYREQIRTYATQGQVVDMQQNARVGMYFLERELRLAGLDPTGDAGAGVVTGDRATVTITMDFTGGENDGNDNDNDGASDETDGTEWFNGVTTDAAEQVTFALSNDDGDGICDGLGGDLAPCNLTRDTGGGPQILAMNIDGLRFDYFGIDSADPNCDIDCALGVPVANPENIRGVQITLIARAGAAIPVYSVGYRDTHTWRTPGGDILLNQQNDGFRRLRLTSLVNLRNMGL